jgi:hypothetical protein
MIQLQKTIGVNMTDNKSNSVEFVHPDYMAYADIVNTTRNVFNGIGSTKNYIYKLERESISSYNNRLANATLKNFVKRATEAFVGMIFRKQIEVTGFDDRMTNIFGKIDRKNSLNIFAREMTTNLIVDGKVFVGIDSDIDGESDPYVVLFKRNQITNWRQDEQGRYTLVVIQEVVTVESGEFGNEEIIQYRVYKDDGNVDLYRDSGNGFIFYDTIETEYDYIPIVDITLSDIPPLYDISKLTIKHTNRTSIKDKYLDMCATPIPIIWSPDSYNEDDPSRPVFVVGADEGFVFNGAKEECDFEWRELQGSSIDKLQEDLTVIEEDITTGVIRAASSDSNTIKTATQAYYEASESANRVVVMANAVELGLNKIVKILADIANVELPEESRVILNKDFNAIAGNSDSVRLLWEVYLGGTLSTETFLDSLAKFELVDIGNVKDEMTRIENDKFKPKPKVKQDDILKNSDNRTTGAMKEE